MFFRSKKLLDVLNETKKVKVHGIKFTIRKVNILNYLDGSKVLQQTFDTYKHGNDPIPNVSEKKIADYFSEVIVAGVVEPKISFKEEDGNILVSKLFTDWDLVSELYSEIMLFTYGKKKGQLKASQKTN